jgi:hypothetical protein
VNLDSISFNWSIYMADQIAAFAPKPTTIPQASGAIPPAVKNDENSQLLALRAQIIKAYSDALPLQGDAKKSAIEIFSKLLDEKNIKRTLYAEKQGDTGYRFKEILRDLLKRLGGAESDRGKDFVAALRNSLNLNFSIEALASKPSSETVGGAQVAQTPAPVTQPVAQPVAQPVTQPVASSSSAASPLNVLAASVAPTAEQQTAFQNDPTLQNTQINAENAPSSALLLISALGSNVDFMKALSPEGNKILGAMDPKKHTLAELLSALDKAIDASPDAAASLAPYKALIAKVLAIDKASTGTLIDVPPESDAPVSNEAVPT